MLKKSLFVLLFTFCQLSLVTGHARAELKIDIVAGAADPIPIAIQKIESIKSNAKDANMLRDVVISDLKSSGLFRIIDTKAFPQNVKMDDLPNFNDWSMIKAQVLVQAKLTSEKDGNYKLQFYVWDIAGKEQIEAQFLVSSKKSARRMAHIMADAIYERLTGEIGYFDTQIICIAETGDVSNRIKRMAIMDSDGFGFRYISDANTFVMSPHFSPNMQTVVFLSYRNDDPSVWTLDMNTGEQRKLGKFGGMTFAPRWSTDGNRVALSLAKGGATNIYEYNIQNKSLRQLTNGDYIDTSPSYSPDGTQLAFNSNRSGSQQIHVLDLKSGNIRRLTYGAGRYATPAYSPDGNFLAFTKIADDTFYIGIMSPTGKNEKILASGWFMESPSWAPSSRRVVYFETVKPTDTERVSHIRSVDINGMNDYEIKLPDGIGGAEPTWSPRLP